MARPGISQLDDPPLKFRPDKLIDGFETVRKMRREDQRRAKLLSATKHSGLFGARAQDLATRLAASTPKAVAMTPACALYMRQQRIKVVGHLHKLVKANKKGPTSTFTVVKESWATFAGDLFDLDPRKLKQAFRQDLNRCGAGAADGWLFAALDCEYFPDLKCYQFHIHGVATNGMIAVVEKLRKRRGYKPWKGVPGVPDCKRPVVISGAVLKNLPRPIAYAVKHFWKVKVGGKAVRLPGDEHTRALLFLDRYRLEDLTLLVNLSVSNGQLKIS